MAYSFQNNGFGQSIFISRAGSGGDITSRKYNLIIGGCLLWGFLFNFLTVTFFGDAFFAWVSKSTMTYFAFLIGYIVLAVAGAVVCSKSDKASTSFLGYNLLVLPLGLFLCILCHQFSSTIISKAFFTTMCVTGLMICMAVIFPNFFLSIGRGLFFALLCVMIVQLLTVFIFRINPTMIDIVVAAIFCGYIGYDWARSQRLPYTVNNAIDCSCALYLDIFNLFVRILSLFGRESR